MAEKGNKDNTRGARPPKEMGRVRAASRGAATYVGNMDILKSSVHIRRWKLEA